MPRLDPAPTNAMTTALDRLDRAILARLQTDGRETHEAIGAQVGLSASAVLRRIRRLEEAGVIDRYVALLRPEALGLGLSAYVNVRLEKRAEHGYIIFKHLVPNTLGIVVVSMTLGVPAAIFQEAYLSFIGLGIKPPIPSWGQLANLGVSVFRIYPSQLLIPAIMISLTMLSFNLFGDGLRDALDPKLRR